MHQEDRIYTSKRIKGLFTLRGLFTYSYVGMVDRPKSLWSVQKTSLTQLYSNEDIKIFHWRKSKMYLVPYFIYGAV